MMLVVFCFQTLKNKKKACTLNLATKNKVQIQIQKTDTKNKVSNIMENKKHQTKNNKQQT